MKISKYLFRISRFANKYTFPYLGSIAITPYIINCQLFEIIFYGIPNAIFISLSSYYLIGSCFWHLIYFYFICYYLRIRIRSLNKRLEKRVNIYNTVINFNQLYKQIQEYNDIFWSKYLLCVWLFMGFSIIDTLFIILFIPFNFIIKLIFIYALLVYGLIFFFVIFTASSVQFEAKKSYKLLNKFYVKLLFPKLYVNRINLKIKVSKYIVVFEFSISLKKI